MKPLLIRCFMSLLTSQGHSLSKMCPTIVGNYKWESVTYNVGAEKLLESSSLK